MPSVGGYYHGPSRAIIVVFACDLVDRGRSLGPESLRRLEKAADVYRRLGDRSVKIVVSAGFAPNRSEKFPLQELSMAELQYEALLEMGVHPAHIVLAGNPLTWGSLAELGAAVRIRNVERKHTCSEYPIYLVTSFVHSWRVRYLARVKFAIDDREILVCSVRPSFIVAAIELVKFPLQVIQLRSEMVRKKGPARR